MLRRLTLFFIIIACAYAPAIYSAAPIAPQEQAAWAASNAPENLEYNIYFHIGLINAKAGFGKLSFTKETDKNGQTVYHSKLAGKSLSIVEHIMRVRDTLDCYFNEDMVPLRFRKGTHEGSYNALANYYYRHHWHNKSAANTKNVGSAGQPNRRLNDVDSTSVVLKRWRKKGKEDAVNREVHFTNEGPAYDMLSVFYSVRHLDYEHMKKGKRMKFVCYDGITQQIINVDYCGVEKCEMRNGKTHKAFLIDLNFATKGQDSTPLKVWLSTTPDHRPLKAIIGLKRIGSIRCEIQE